MSKTGGLLLTGDFTVPAADGERQSPETGLADGTAAPGALTVGAGVEAFDRLVDTTNGCGGEIGQRRVEVAQFALVGLLRDAEIGAVFTDSCDPQLQVVGELLPAGLKFGAKGPAVGGCGCGGDGWHRGLGYDRPRCRHYVEAA